MNNSAASTLSVDNLTALATRKHFELLDKFPQYQSIFGDPLVHPFDQTQQKSVLVSVVEHLKPSREVTEVVKTELSGVFDKMSNALSDSTLLSDAQLRLYLEQQLTDLLGIPISSESNGERLPVTQGFIEALPHTTTAIGQTVSAHGQIFEAGLSPFRYEVPTLLQQQPNDDVEQYSFLYPIWMNEDFSSNPTAKLKQYCAQQFVLINPLQRRILVAQCIGLKSPSYRYILAGSPEVLRQGRFWWPGCHGQLLCFAISAPTATGLLYAD